MKDFWHLVGVEELQIMAAVDSNFILVDFILLFCQMGIRVKLVIYSSATAEDEWNLWWT